MFIGNPYVIAVYCRLRCMCRKQKSARRPLALRTNFSKFPSFAFYTLHHLWYKTILSLCRCIQRPDLTNLNYTMLICPSVRLFLCSDRRDFDEIWHGDMFFPKDELFSNMGRIESLFRTFSTLRFISESCYVNTCIKRSSVGY